MPSSSAIAPVSGAQDRPPLHGVAGFEAVTTTSGDLDDAFFRQMVSSMRNGVLAITREGAVAVMNAEAYRIFGLRPDPSNLGRAYADVLRMHPDIVRSAPGACPICGISMTIVRGSWNMNWSRRK